MNWSKAANYDREVSFQGRLDKTLERQKIKLHDNSVRLVGVPEDVVVIKKKTTVNGDTISKVISDIKLMNMVFPVLKDVPIRRIKKNEFEDGYVLTSLVSSYGEGGNSGFGNHHENLTNIKVQIPLKSNLDVGDTIVRVFVQESVAQSTVAVFEVVELLADLSNNAPLTNTAIVALSTEPIDLNKPSYKMITALAERRLAAKY